MDTLSFFKLIILSIYILLVEAKSINPTNGIKKIPENESEASCYVKLDFSNMGLKIINQNFISSPHVRSIILKSNDIANFNENSFSSLPNLENLDLSNNILAPQLFSFGEISSLKYLVLDNNFPPTSKIDPVYFCCPYGTVYVPSVGCVEECQGNQIMTTEGKCLDEFSNLEVPYVYPALEYLSLRKVSANSIPHTWESAFPVLDYLDLSYNNFQETSETLFENLPSTVTRLVLESIGLSNFQTERLENISLLNLNKNNFKILSSEDCYENTLCLRGLGNLRTLSISGCSIEKIEIDAFEKIEKLEHLNMSNNNFEEFPEEIFEYTPFLSLLDLSQNILNVIPGGTNSLKNLNTLIMNDMKDNKIFELSLFSQTSELEVLSLRHNNLDVIPSTILINLPRLRELDLQDNHISFLSPWPSLNKLRRLNLIHNEVTNIELIEELLFSFE